MEYVIAVMIVLLFSGIIALWVKKEYEIQEKMVSETANKHKKESNIDT